MSSPSPSSVYIIFLLSFFPSRYLSYPRSLPLCDPFLFPRLSSFPPPFLVIFLPPTSHCVCHVAINHTVASPFSLYHLMFLSVSLQCQVPRVPLSVSFSAQRCRISAPPPSPRHPGSWDRCMNLGWGWGKGGEWGDESDRCVGSRVFCSPLLMDRVLRCLSWLMGEGGLPFVDLWVVYLLCVFVVVCSSLLYGSGGLTGP